MILLFNIVLLFSLFSGSRIDLASVRARKATLGRRSPLAMNNRVPLNRVAHTSRDPVRREVLLARSESVRALECHASKKASSSLPNKDSGSKVAKDDGVEERRIIHDEVRKRNEEEEPRQPKKNRVDDFGASSKPSRVKHIFVDGINHREKVDSFWDLDDPEIGLKKGRTIVGDFDMVHLLSLPTESFAHALSWNSCQSLSLACAVRVREEKLRNEVDKFREDVLRLKEENRQLSEEIKKGDVERLQAQRSLEDKVKSFTIIEEKYDVELRTGGHFLDSEAGKKFLKNVENKSVRSYKASSAFHDEVLDQAVTIHDDLVLACRDQLRKNGVSEEIVMLIEPSVLEAIAIVTDDIPLGDSEMIDALKLQSINDEA